MPHNLTKLLGGIVVAFILFVIGISGFIPALQTSNTHKEIVITGTTNSFEVPNSDRDKYYFYIESTNEDIDTEDLLITYGTGSNETIFVQYKNQVLVEFQLTVKSNNTDKIIDVVRNNSNEHTLSGGVNVAHATYYVGTYQPIVSIKQGSFDDLELRVANENLIGNTMLLIRSIIVLLVSLAVGLYFGLSYRKSVRGSQYESTQYDLKAAFERKNKRTYGSKLPQKDDDPFGEEDPFKDFK